MGTKLLITNLPLTMDAGDLEDMFTMIGDVSSSVIDKQEETGMSLGVGHVEMVTEVAAQSGIQHFHGQVKFGYRLVVREDKPHVFVASAVPKRSLFKSVKSVKKMKARGKKL